MKTLIEISKLYFTHFSNKDLQNLEKMFHSEIILRDWEIKAVGIKEVLKANLKIFNNVNSICVKPLHIYNDKSTVIAEIEININSKEILLVVDIIKFNKKDQITSIHAYKG